MTDFKFRVMYVLSFILILLTRRKYHQLVKAEQQATTYHESQAKRFFISNSIVGAIGYLVLYLVSPKVANWGTVRLASWVRWVGVGITTVALMINWWVHQALGSNFSDVLEIRERHQLVTDGPYHWVRHPMYVVFILFGVGTLLISANLVIGLPVLGLIIWIIASRIEREEGMLLDKFGEPYRRYKERTGRFLPRI